MEVFGVDVSHHQGAINWSKVVESGKVFAIMKCQYEAQSHRIDEQFEANYKGCADNGISKGVYIYIARASMADIEGDAYALLDKLKGRPLEYGIWLDLEDKSVEVKGKAYIRDLAYRYAKIFKAAGYFVGIYTNKAWYDTLIHEDLKRDFDIWFARYPKNDVGSYNATSSLKPSASMAVAWQYSSKGRVNGIKGNVDLNVDFDGVINLCSRSVEKPLYREPFTNVKKGATGNGVKWIQDKLNSHGYSLKVDGIWGNATEKCVKDFQLKNGLVVDGIVGAKTKAALKGE